MRKNRLNKGKYRKKKKFIIMVSMFIVCILFVGVGVGIKFTQRAKASSEAENNFKVQPISTNENKIQNDTTNDQAKNVGKNTDNSKNINSNSIDNTSSSDKNNTVNSAPSSNNGGNSQQSSSNNTTPPSGENGGSPPPPNNVEPPKNKVAYLTFDDGPSTTVTPEILDILKEENVQATFFIIGSYAEKNPDLLRREKAEGHSIGNHTYSHNYNYIYASTDNFINDLKKCDTVITSIVGDHDRSLIRFPGGSFNRQSYKQAIEAAGYHYVDWNCLNGDAEVSLASVDRLLLRFNQTFGNQDKLIILMHDAPAKKTTPKALPQIIQTLKAKGYTFKGL